MNEDERDEVYERGRKAVLSELLRKCCSELGIDDPEGAAARWITERMELVATLRSICEDYGDNNWPDNLSLSDVINKHINWE